MAEGQGLDRNILIVGIKAANNKVRNITDENSAWETWIEEMAKTIEEYVKSAKVVTVGSSTNQTGKLT